MTTETAKKILGSVRDTALTIAALDAGRGDWIRGKRDAALEILAVLSPVYGPPPAATVCAYMAAAGWAEQSSGPAGSMWVKDDTWIAVPSSDTPVNQRHLMSAIERVARAEERGMAEVIQNINLKSIDQTERAYVSRLWAGDWDTPEDSVYDK